jgi:hypothetical protein
MRSLRILVVILAAAAMSMIAPAQSHYTFTSIASLSDYGGYFEPATLTNADDVLFAPALLTGGEGVLLWHYGRITTIAQGGQPTLDNGLCWPPTFPSDCPVFGYTFSPIQMNERDDVAFVMSRDGINNVPTPLGINAGVYRYNSRTGIVPVMVPGMPAPGGGLFWGSFFWVSIPGSGDVYFPGWVCTTATVSYPTQACPEGPGVLSQGVYKADPRGNIRAVVKPGDAAPGGSYFDYTTIPAANERGDVAFGGHIYSDECISNPYGPYCYDSVFLKDGQSGRTVTVARIGDRSPVQGKTYTGVGTPTLNATGDFAFYADFSPARDGSDDAVLLYSHGRTIVIAKTGDSMPDGETLAKVGTAGGDIAMNNAGDIVFDATLTDGTQAIYLWRHGHLSPVAITETHTGAGVISNFDDFGYGWASTQLWINDWGQILFMAHFQDGGGAMLVATPK